MIKSLTVAALALQTLSSFAVSAEVVPQVDQLAYAARLRRERPDLWLRRADHCKNELILKPIYRDQVLQRGADFETIAKREYTAEKQAADRRWADSHRLAAETQRIEIDAELKRQGLDPADRKDSKVRDAQARLPFFVKNYSPERYVGYGIGPAAFEAPPAGEYVRYKVYLEFKSAVDDLSPEAYLAFMKELGKAGYQGDSKVQLWPGVARFKFNNIVLHARGKADAYIAERVGHRVFRGKLASTGRGLDVDTDDEDGFDWSQFVCVGDVTRLPKEALEFVTYKD